jgi:F-type H+-transporting ATPase subunit delta
MSGPAKRYARALFSQTGEALALHRQASGILDSLSKAISETPELRRFVANPLIPVNAARETLLRLLPGDASVVLRSFISLLADRRRLNILPDIAAAYRELLTEAGYLLYIEVSSAYPLDDDQYARLGEIYRSRYKAQAVDITKAVDASLIGSIRVRAGDDVADGTIKMKLALLTNIGS